jgi:hypothetical protein
MSAALLSTLMITAIVLPMSAQDVGEIRLNQIQVIGTHNSYHAGLQPNEFKALYARSPRAAESLEYSHPTLTRQLDGGVRQLELDVFYDPQGGRFAHPGNLAVLQAAGQVVEPPYDPEHDMDKPGFKVMHVQDVDQRSRCALFVNCLKEVRSWSKSHPEHVPVFILVETKQGALKGVPGAKEALPFTPAVFDALDAEILSVFSRNEVITPDDVRGTHGTLPEAVAQKGWPTLAQSRGKIVFLLDQRSNEPIYTQGHPALKGRVLFTNAVPGAPDAAFTEGNDAPVGELDALVKQGYLVRARTDADTKQARSGDVSRRDAVLGSGAQMLSTDYPQAEPASWTGFSVALPGGGEARCNPVNAPAGCKLN